MNTAAKVILKEIQADLFAAACEGLVSTREFNRAELVLYELLNSDTLPKANNSGSSVGSDAD